MPTSQYFKPTSFNTQTSTPSTTSGQLTNPSFTGNIGSIFTGLGFGQSQQATPAGPFGTTSQSLQNSANKAQVTPTATGGVSFDPSMASGYNKPAPAQNTVSQPTSGASGLAQYTLNHSSTPNGGTLAMDGNGSPAGYTPSNGYNIDTSSSIPSNAISGNLSSNSLAQSHGSYADYVNALSQAQGYSPAYQQAQAGVYGAQATGAQLGVNQAAYANQAFGANQANNGGGLNYGPLGGATTDFVSGQIGSEQSGNAIKQSLNAQQLTNANINLNTQQLARTGAIQAATTQLNSSPEGMAGQNAIAQYNTLQQQYPGANIPEYNQSLTPEQNQQVASYIVANSPAYKAQFQQQYSTAGGGTGIYNKLDTGLLNQNSDGTISLVNDGAAITGAADKSSASTLTSQINSLTPAYNAANQDFTYLTNFMQSAGINQSNVPAINQVQQAVGAKLLDPGAVAEFKAGIASLRTNYAALLGSRGETPTQAGSDAQQLVPDTLSPAQLTQVQNALNVNGKNIIDANQSQLQTILSRYGGQAGSTNLNGGSTQSSGWGSLGD